MRTAFTRRDPRRCVPPGPVVRCEQGDGILRAGAARGSPGRPAGRARGHEAARPARRAPPPRRRGGVDRPADRRALGRRAAADRVAHRAGVRLAPAEGARRGRGRAGDRAARLRRPAGARRARPRSLRAPRDPGPRVARRRATPPQPRLASARRSAYGVGRRSPTSPTRPLPRRRSPGSRSFGSPPSPTASRRTSRSAATTT